MTIDYKKAEELVKGRGKRKIANNTYLEQIDEVYVVRLYDTDIIKIYPDNTQVLFSGGFRTVTTKNRINEFSFTRVHQDKKVWHFRSGERFFEGARISESGKVIC